MYFVHAQARIALFPPPLGLSTRRGGLVQYICQYEPSPGPNPASVSSGSLSTEGEIIPWGQDHSRSSPGRQAVDAPRVGTHEYQRVRRVLDS